MNPISNLSYLLPPLIAAFCFFILLVVVLASKGRRKLGHRLFSIFLLTVSLGSIFTFFMRSSPSVEESLPWDKAVAAMILISSALYYHFTLTYTNSKKNRRLTIGTYVFILLAVALAPTNLLIDHMTLQSYGYAYTPGLLLFPMALFAYFLMAMGLYTLIKAYRASSLYEERNRYIYIAIAALFPVIGTIIDFFPSVYPMAILGNVIFCLLTTIAILKYHLLDIYLVIRKGLAYVIMSTIVAVPYVGIIILFNNLVGSNTISTWGYPAILVVLALLLQPLWQIVQRVVDKWFYRERYDFLKQLEYFSQEAHDISDLKRLGSSLVGLVRQALQTSSVHLLLRSEYGDFSVVSSAGADTPELTLKDHSPLLRWLQSNKGIIRQQDLDIVPQLQSLSTKERNDLNDVGAELFVPLKTNKDELVGMLILGEKLSQQFYSDEDKRLISTVAKRVAIELENARLYTLETMMRQELEMQDAQKTEFLHSIAHELKTPLTAIISSSELMSTDGEAATPSIKERLVANINRSAWLMDRRVGELLDLAKIQIGNLKLQLQPLEISVVIDEVVSQLSSLFKNKGQSLTVEIQDSLPQVKADKERVQQVLLNLLSNANKFSPTGGAVMLRTREADSSILVEVADSATAVSKEDRDKLFDAYYRGGSEDERQRVPGLGLGLAISRRIVELHQGNIWVESEPGKGNTFIFSLPIWNEEQIELDKSPTLFKIGGKIESTNR